jgi:hypothetical protein
MKPRHDRYRPDDLNELADHFDDDGSPLYRSDLRDEDAPDPADVQRDLEELERRINALSTTGIPPEWWNEEYYGDFAEYGPQGLDDGTKQIIHDQEARKIYRKTSLDYENERTTKTVNDRILGEFRMIYPQFSNYPEAAISIAAVRALEAAREEGKHPQRYMWGQPEQFLQDVVIQLEWDPSLAQLPDRPKSHWEQAADYVTGRRSFDAGVNDRLTRTFGETFGDADEPQYRGQQQQPRSHTDDILAEIDRQQQALDAQRVRLAQEQQEYGGEGNMIDEIRSLQRRNGYAAANTKHEVSAND